MTNSRLARMWASQCKTKPQPILAVETHARGLKRKLFNLVGGVEEAGMMGTICVFPCLCPAGRLNRDTANGALEDGMDSSGAAGGEFEVPDKPESVEMPSQAVEGDGMPADMECSKAAGDGSLDQPSSVEVEMLSQSQTVQMPSQSQMSQGNDELGS